MSPQDLANAIISGINAGGEQFLEGTIAAMLPVVWLALLGLHLGRPYILDMIDRFTLRLGADLLWLVYIALRDLLIVSGVVMSFMFFFPDVVTTDNLPLTGGLAAVCLFGVLLIKLMGDPDQDPRAFRWVTYLLALGALFYFVGTSWVCRPMRLSAAIWSTSAISSSRAPIRPGRWGCVMCRWH
jgi:hypothetical protein